MKQVKTIADPKFVARLTWPIFVELLMQLLVGNMDQLMMGRISQVSVAAIGNANQVINLVILTFSVISTATTILIAQYLGSNNRQKVNEIYTLALTVNTGFSLVISLVLIFLGRPIFQLMQVEAQVLEESVLYLAIIGAGMCLQAVFLTFSAIFKSNALMRQSMIISIVINVANIVGNYLLISGVLGLPKLGIVGVAISSDLSRLIGVVIMLYIFFRQMHGEIRLRFLRPFPWAMLKKLLKIGVPSGGESLSYNLTQVCVMGIANTFGMVVVTTKVYATMFANISYVYSSAIGQAAQIVVGYLIGAGDTDGADARVKSTLKRALAASVIISVVLFIFSDFMFGFFTPNPEVLSLGRKIMAIEIVLEIGRAFNIVLVRGLQASGDVQYPTTVGIICMWSLAVGLGFLLAVVAGWGLVGLWIGMMCDECTRAVIFVLRWKSGKWKNKNLIGETAAK